MRGREQHARENRGPQAHVESRGGTASLMEASLKNGHTTSHEQEHKRVNTEMGSSVRLEENEETGLFSAIVHHCLAGASVRDRRTFSCVYVYISNQQRASGRASERTGTQGCARVCGLWRLVATHLLSSWLLLPRASRGTAIRAPWVASARLDSQDEKAQY